MAHAPASSAPRRVTQLRPRRVRPNRGVARRRSPGYPLRLSPSSSAISRWPRGPCRRAADESVALAQSPYGRRAGGKRPSCGCCRIMTTCTRRRSRSVNAASSHAIELRRANGNTVATEPFPVYRWLPTVVARPCAPAAPRNTTSSHSTVLRWQLGPPADYRFIVERPLISNRRSHHHTLDHTTMELKRRFIFHGNAQHLAAVSSAPWTSSSRCCRRVAHGVGGRSRSRSARNVLVTKSDSSPRRRSRRFVRRCEAVRGTDVPARPREMLTTSTHVYAEVNEQSSG